MPFRKPTTDCKDCRFSRIKRPKEPKVKQYYWCDLMQYPISQKAAPLFCHFYEDEGEVQKGEKET